MATVEEKYPFMTVNKSIIDKDWAAGTKKQVESKEFLIDSNGVGRYETFCYSPAFAKCIDEPIVNALDHMVRCRDSDHKVTYININFDPSCGLFSITNDGPGVEVVVHAAASRELGFECYVPSFIFGTTFIGSNHGSDSIVGGTNGLGAKITNCFSNEFMITTIDSTRGLKFEGIWQDHMNTALPAKITKCKNKSMFELSAALDYTLFGYGNDADISHLADLVRARAYFAAAYATYVCGTKFKFMYNRAQIKCTMSSLVSMFFPDAPVVKATLCGDANGKYPWDVIVAITDTSAYDLPYISNVNGIVVRDGKHLKHLMNSVTSAIKTKIAKQVKDKDLKFKSALVSSNIFIFVNSMIPSPGWSGQRKDVLDVPASAVNKYTFNAATTNAISKHLFDIIAEHIMETPKVKVKKTPDYDKYTEAKRCSQEPLKCTLIAVEGDSAMTQVCIGISNNGGFNYYGAISLGGVIMNARRECKIVTAANTQMVRSSTKLTNNIFMTVLRGVTGLQLNYKYDPESPTYAREMSELRYGALVACVDQDLDGKGNILGLLLSTFELFWPNLIRAGYVKWFATPIIRAYPQTGRVLEFYSTAEYDKWYANNGSNASARFNIKYYKGLGTHGREEAIHMFKAFDKKAFTYCLDARSHELFEIYFGVDADLRKVELAQPTKQPVEITDNIISCSDHLEYETNLYQKDNIERKLDHVIDGQNQSGRKILDGLIKAFKGTSKQMKVAQLAGYISEHENYHHGEASLSEGITRRGLVTPGGKQLPLIVPLSNFGSRRGGGKDASSPRYIYTTLNTRLVELIFNPNDYWILPFNFDEGKRCEPEYFVPVVPMAVLESTEVPAHGWNFKTWARDIRGVIENVRRMIKFGADVPLLNMQPCVYHGSAYEWRGTFRTICGKLYSFGSYKIINDNTIIIDELPLRTWTIPYVQALKKKLTGSATDLVKSIHDSSDDIRVSIEIKLKSGALEKISQSGTHATDGIEEYFGLKDYMDDHLNMIGMRHEVIEFKNYADIVKTWFPVRKEFYATRIARELTLAQLEIKYFENQVKYIMDKHVFSNKSVDFMIATLAEQKFDKFNHTRLQQPKWTPVDQLEHAIMVDGASYDYLLNMSDRSKSTEALVKIQAMLEKSRSTYAMMLEQRANESFAGATAWLNELDALEQVIKLGFATTWTYETKAKHVFD